MSRILYFVLLVTSINLIDARLKTNEPSIDLFNFEQIKNDLFLKYASQVPNKTIEISRSGINDVQCLFELNAIKNGIQNSQRWAQKIVDAWGKIPSAVFDGNLVEFGGFSECFHIERDEELYKTQYCLGNLIIDIDGIFTPSKTYSVNNSPIGLNWETKDVDPVISPRIVLPKPKDGQGITFGLCLPAICSLDFLEPIINDLIQEKVKNVSIEFDKSTCQFEEYATKLRTIDKVTLVFWFIITCFVLTSTCYDILYTLSNREKSQALLAFSFYTNGMKLMSYKRSKSPDVMKCIDGIRAISTQYVVLGHTFLMYMYLPGRNKIYFTTFVRQYQNMIIFAAPIAVDTFFVLSGLFVTISMLKHLEKTKGKLNVPLLYVHRYIRLTPMLALTILSSITILRLAGNGPLWPNLIISMTEQCERNWWTTLLYVQNYVNPKDLCFTHSWYLSVDTQLFLISPLVVYSIYKLKAKTIPVWILLVIGCIGCTLATHMKYEYNNMLRSKDYLAIAYIPTHLRYSPWLVGVIAGYFFYKVRGSSVRIPRLFNLIAWVISLALMATVIFAIYPFSQLDTQATPLEFGLYESLSRVAWSIALCYIIFACVHGYGGPVNWFLSHPLWQPLSRLSYAIYLMHMPIILLTTATMKNALYFTEFSAFQAFIANYVITVSVAIVATLMFESPVIIFEKLIFGPRKKSRE